MTSVGATGPAAGQFQAFEYQADNSKHFVVEFKDNEWSVRPRLEGETGTDLNILPGSVASQVRQLDAEFVQGEAPVAPVADEAAAASNKRKHEELENDELQVEEEENKKAKIDQKTPTTEEISPRDATGDEKGAEEPVKTDTDVQMKDAYPGLIPVFYLGTDGKTQVVYTPKMSKQ